MYLHFTFNTMINDVLQPLQHLYFIIIPNIQIYVCHLILILHYRVFNYILLLNKIIIIILWLATY